MKELKYFAYIVPAVMAYKGDAAEAILCTFILGIILDER